MKHEQHAVKLTELCFEALFEQLYIGIASCKTIHTLLVAVFRAY